MSFYLVESTDDVSTERFGQVSALWRRLRPVGPRQRSRDRERTVDDAQRVADIKWQWRLACEVSGLYRVVFTPSGQAVSVPMIGRVELGPPTTFTVRLPPGQLPDDIVAVGPRIAEAMAVSGIGVRPLVAGWVTVELQPEPARSDGLDQPRRAAFGGPTRQHRGPLAA